MYESDPPPRARSWRILSLDGGGVRGLAELLILQRIFSTMEAIVGDELGSSARPLLPSDFFDLIGGTSTGGLIALLIGRLKMPIPEAITTFRSLSQRIFPTRKGNWLARKVAVATSKTIYDATVLETEMRKLLEQKTGNPEIRMIEDENPPCRVFVCATRVHTTSSILLRTYAIRDPGQANHSVKIWQAARATSAAPPFFDPITIHDCGMTLLDGAFRLNNPINETLSEACDLDPHREYGCIVSIGTGLADVPSLENSRWLLNVAHSCVQIAIDCEDIAAKFLKGPTGRQAHDEGRYFRFNVPRRLYTVGIDEWEKHEAVQEYVETYLETMGKQLDQCARTLLIFSGYQVSPASARSRGLSSQIITPPPEIRTANPWEQPQAQNVPDTYRALPIGKSLVPPSPSISETSSLLSSLSLGPSNASISSYPLDLSSPSPRQPPINTTATPSLLSGSTAYSPSPSQAQTISSLSTTPQVEPRHQLQETISEALATATNHLSLKNFNHAYTHFKTAINLLKTLPSSVFTVASLVNAHIGMAESLLQAASAKAKSSPPKAFSHLTAAEASVTRALSVVQRNCGPGDKERGVYMAQVELAFVIIAIMKVEMEAEGGIVDRVQAGCLVEKIDGVLKGLEKSEGTEGVRRKGEAWRRRLMVRYCGLAELGGDGGPVWKELSADGV